MTQATGPLFSTYDLATADDEMFGAAVNGRPQCLPLLKDTAVHQAAQQQQ